MKKKIEVRLPKRKPRNPYAPAARRRRAGPMQERPKPDRRQRDWKTLLEETGE